MTELDAAASPLVASGTAAGGGAHFGPGYRARARVHLLGDALILTALGCSVLAVHDIPYLLHHPFWIDEAWVADSIRAPLSKIPFLTSSTPIGWTLLLKLVPGAGHTQRARLVVVVFAGLAAMAGYVLGEELRISRHLTGLLVGAAVLLSPAMLVSDELKQYTAEGFASIGILLLAARLDNSWSRRRLATLGAFVSVGFLFAATDVLVGAAVFAGLLVEAAIRRDRRRAAEAFVAGAATGAACAVLYLLTAGPNVIPSLTAYWTSYFLTPDRGIAALMHTLHVRADQLAPFAAFGSLWATVPLAIAGVVLLALHGRWALALALPFTLLINGFVSLARAYPFGDERTSTFWLVMVPVLIAIAVSYAARWASKVSAGIPLASVAAALLVWVPSTHRYIDARTLPSEDVRSQVTNFESLYRPGDILILDETASFGFAFYDEQFRPVYAHRGVLANGFQPVYPQLPWIVEMYGRQPADVARALSAARHRLRSEPPGSRGVVWIIRSHMSSAEAHAWSTDLPDQSVKTIGPGPEPLLEYTPAS